MKRLISLFAALVFSSVGAQTVQTTPNLITSGTTHTWTGVSTGSLTVSCPPGGGACSGGPGALYDPATNSINYSYGQVTASQTFAINQALANVGAGVQVKGYNYSWDVNNLNRDNRQGSTDTLTATVVTYAANNSTVLRTDSWTYNTNFDWTTFSGTVNYTTPAAPSSFGNLKVSFSGKDSGFWGGYYGPQVRNVNIGINYTVDPCATNPAYSTSCANYNTVTTSGNLFTGTTGTQAYAINTALALAGAGTMIHGFDYGYDYRAAGRTCAIWDLFGLCLTGYNYSLATVTTELTNSAGVVGYTETNTHAGGNNGVSGTYSKSLRLSSSVAMSTLGTFSMTPTVSGDADITNMYSRAVYTPDPCTVNPLSSTSCAGYAQAYQDQQCASNPLYATTCTGYQQAYFSQQCTANALYNSGCPGYATAYYNYQCSINPLGDNTCPGYAVAYHDQQCSISPLFMSDCPGYAQAYKTQQCTINALYATDCPGYAQAYKNQQCSLNPLYASDCLGYQQAYMSQQCSLNGLYDRSCPNYGTAYATKNVLSTPTTTATVTPTVTAVTTTTTSTTNSNPATVAISDTNVSNAISTPSTTSVTSPTSVTTVVTTTATVPTAASPTAAATVSATAPIAVTPAQAAATAAENKKTDTAVASVEKKSNGNTEAARKEATEKAKELANEAGKAATLEAQTATQGLVVGLMGYVPGFSAYQNSIVPDVNIAKMTRQYNKPVVDNRTAQRRLSGASDAKWQEMVDSQYKMGDK